ncbi:hypothetical protein BT93_L5643 [Corymbia citriodora subsp. variegata]|uniref:glutathione-specific gamma-glutamylcyclotransferase n=1 Tax=Corymbia citriodora subsp. variegata TaxID=360336 RepID=A0A8T0CEY3_CORYI|nr:hypothetical protein BT93_L5643 [Corymbia citriodora subsp. variegata]
MYTNGESATYQQDFWLFGYGSLIWKPPPHFDRRVPGYIDGFVRHTHASSEDHRGTPEDPGRVVTLIDKSFWETVWGAAYHIIPENVEEVKAYLDIREINGYSIQYTDFQPAEQTLPVIKCLVYIGMPDNPQFLGALQPEDVAEKINQSRGPSGENRDYLLNLEQALLELSPGSKDQHISDLAARVRGMARPDRSVLRG